MGYRWNQPAYSLSYANRRRLEIARAMATNPRLLLLDEPAAGMNPEETHEITEQIAQAPRRGRLHDLRHRARHARRRGDLRPRRRARPRRQDRRGVLRGGGHEPAGVEAYLGAGGGGARSERGHRLGDGPLLEFEHVNTYYGQIHILEDSTRRLRAGELVCLLGGNASGQIDDAEDRSSASSGRGAGRVASKARTSPRSRRHRIARGHGDRAREPAPVRADDRAREPPDGRVPARHAARRRTSTASTRFSRCCTSGAPSSPGRSPAASSRWSRWPAR